MAFNFLQQMSRKFYKRSLKYKFFFGSMYDFTGLFNYNSHHFTHYRQTSCNLIYIYSPYPSQGKFGSRKFA